jgi:exodeoxyribonuclease-3
MRLATWNVNSLAVRLPQVLDWLAAQQPDVLVLQETKLTDDRFPHAEMEAAGWQRAVVRPEDLQRRRAAVTHARRALDVVRNIPGFADEQRARDHRLTVGGAARDRSVLSQRPGARQREVRIQDAAGCAALRDWLRDRNRRSTRIWCSWATSTSPPTTATCTIRWPGPGRSTAPPEERGALQEPRFDSAWWTRSGSSSSRRSQLVLVGLPQPRLPQESGPSASTIILVSEALLPHVRCASAPIDKAPRRNERPSDHAPVVVEYRLEAGASSTTQGCGRRPGPADVASVVEPQFLDLAGDGVAADAQPLRCLDPSAARECQARSGSGAPSN